MIKEINTVIINIYKINQIESDPFEKVVVYTKTEETNN